VTVEKNFVLTEGEEFLGKGDEDVPRTATKSETTE
jgi:hypothetical protein